jgi:effector-binding domain-containing protein
MASPNTHTDNTGATPSSVDTPHIAQSPEQQVALIHLTVPGSEIMTAMGPAFAELTAVLKAQNITPSGPWFAHHLHRPTDIFDFELSIPIATPIQPTGRVANGQLRAATVARTTYTGPYEGLHSAWDHFVAWIQANGHQPASDLWEVYLVSPHNSPDPSTWRTELNVPLTT